MAALRLRVRQVGGTAEIAFTVPEPRGPEASQRPASAQVVRVAYPPGPKPPADPDAFRFRGEVVAEAGSDRVEPGARVVLVDHGLATLPKGGEGYTLRYGVRLRDARGRPSPLVVSGDLSPAALRPPPSGLEAEVSADGVLLTWEAVPGDPARYAVYRAPEGKPFPEEPQNAEPIAATRWLDGSVSFGTSYLYSVRTILGDGTPPRESEGGPAVPVVALDVFPPAAPRGLVAVQEGSSVRLFWNPNAERDLLGYRVYRRKAGGAWERIGPDPVDEPLYLVRDVRPGDKLEFRVTAVDRASPANESVPSESAAVVVVRDPAFAPEEKP